MRLQAFHVDLLSRQIILNLVERVQLTEEICTTGQMIIHIRIVRKGNFRYEIYDEH